MISVGSPCSASSTTSGTRRSKARPSSASCGATRTSRSCTGCTRCCSCDNSDLHCIVKSFKLDPGKLARDITETLDRLPRGATSISDLSPHIEDSVERAWVWATLKYGDTQVRTGYLMIAHAEDACAAEPAARHLARVREDQGRAADRRSREDLRVGSPEGALGASDGTQFGGQAQPGEASGAIAPAAMGKQEALKKFTVDLTEQARSGKMDPIVGRDDEIRQVVDILMRRRQNNPILIGEAGVGKTAVVEGFAQRIARGDVPPSLKDVELRALDVGLLQAGASMKGEFEQRLRSVIDEVQASTEADHPVHRRNPHAGRRGRRSRHWRRGQPAEAGTGARHAAHRRGDDVRRVQEAHREGPGADATLPVGAGRRTRRSKGDPDDARRGQHDGEAPQGADPRRGARSRGQAQPSLHPGAPVARQEREPARYGLRSGGCEPARHAGRSGRQPQAHRGAGDRARHHRSREGDRHRHRQARSRCRTNCWPPSARGSMH